MGKEEASPRSQRRLNQLMPINVHYTLKTHTHTHRKLYLLFQVTCRVMAMMKHYILVKSPNEEEFTLFVWSVTKRKETM